jgi:predicted phosphodiesterase
VSDFAQNEQTTLIVAGDLLDLSLASLGDALSDLVVLLQNLDSIRTLVWVVGNHDHHVWSMHCEEKNVLARLREGGADWPRTLRRSQEGALHRPTSPDGETLTIFQQALADAVSRPLDVKIAYPAFHLALPDRNSGPAPNAASVLFYFTHGHLFGGVSAALSQMLKDRLVGFPPERVAATVNLPIVELIYWLLGETGEGLGANGLMETIYTDLQKGVDSSARALISDFVDALLPDGIVDGIPDSWERGAVKRLGAYFLKRVLTDHDVSKSKDRYADTQTTRKAAERWVAQAAGLSAADPVHVVYGHTHVADEHEIHGTETRSYNLGGWLVEPNCPPPDTQLLCIEDSERGLCTTCEKV